MLLRKLVFLTSTLTLLCAFSFAQTQPSDGDAEKEKKKKDLDERVVKILEQSVTDAGMLQLPSNRAIVFAISGDLIWKFDEKRARKLFRDSANEIITYNQENEKERSESTDPYIDLYSGQFDPRGEILPLVAKHDAETALDMLLQTRPTKLAEAMARVAAAKGRAANDMLTWNPDRQKADQEIALEQRFALLAADENPEKAIKLIKDSIAKGISPNVLALLQKLNRKDEKKAAELAGDVIKKLIDSDLAKNQDDMRTALNFLQYAFKPEPPTNSSGVKDTKEKLFKFSEDQGRDLARKIADVVLEPSKSMTIAMALNKAMPMLEKFVPDKVALLKMRETENQANLPPEVKEMQKREKVWDPNSTPEEILAHISKSDNEYEKASAYYSLSRKINEIEDDARARKLIEQIPDEKARANALEQYEAARITRTASAGKLDEARKMIGSLTKKKTQIQRLVALATEFQKKGDEKDIVNAKSLMKDAKALTNELAESEDDVADVMEVVKGYATVDPDVGFRMFDPIVDQINEYLQASSVLAKYNVRYSAFKKGELILKVSSNGWDMPLYKYIPQMQLLGKADLDRMNTQADHFGRTDSRMIVRLYVLQGFLKDDKKHDEPEPSDEFYYY